MGSSINTNKQERFPGVSPDGKYLFFTRWYSDPYYHDLYWVDAQIINDLKMPNSKNIFNYLPIIRDEQIRRNRP